MSNSDTAIKIYRNGSDGDLLCLVRRKLVHLPPHLLADHPSLEPLHQHDHVQQEDVSAREGVPRPQQADDQRPASELLRRSAQGGATSKFRKEV